MNEIQERSHIPESIDILSQDIRVCLVCKVISYNEERNSVELSPCVRQRKMSESGRNVDQVSMQDLADVPCLDFGGIRYKPSSGDDGIVIFHDVDLQEYSVSRAKSDVASSRFHDYSDGLFLPCESAHKDRPEPIITIDGKTRDISINAKDVKIKAESLDIEADTTINGVNWTHTHSDPQGSMVGEPKTL